MPEWIKPAAWGAVGGAVAITILGFSADWIMTSGSATAMAQDKAEDAVLDALTPICVARFRAEAADVREAQMAAMTEEGTWDQGDVVAEHGWATLPGMDRPDDDLAEACTEELLQTANRG